MQSLTRKDVRRLALARAGLLKPEWTGFPARGSGASAVLAVIRAFGYLQLDTLTVTGARTQTIVLHSRLPGLEAAPNEDLLRAGGELFEYWAHAACWIPLELYPAFEFRRRAWREHTRSGKALAEHQKLARAVLARVAERGPCRSIDLAGLHENQPLTKHIAAALWGAGELAILERRGFLKAYDLPERVIPEDLRSQSLSLDEALRVLVLLSLAGHGWAALKTIVDTFMLNRLRKEVRQILDDLVAEGAVVPCHLQGGGEETPGWVRPEDLDLAARLRRVRPRPDRGVLLSPFDPLLWDRKRVRTLFGFEQVLEIYKPAAKRLYGYYVLPVLAGERLVARVDLKADRQAGMLRVLARHYEGSPGAAEKQAVESALDRYQAFTGLSSRTP